MIRRLGWLALAMLLASACWGQDEGEWDPSGEFMRRPPSSAAPTQPPGMAQILKSIKSPKLQAYTGRLAQVWNHAAGGDFATGLREAQKLVSRIENESVTREDMPARAVLTAMAQGIVADYQALLGNSREAHDILRRVASNEELPAELRALALADQGYVALLDGDVDDAERYESRAIGVSRATIQPVLAGVRRLYNRQADSALSALKATFGKGSHDAVAHLYAGAAALVLGREAEATQYVEASRPALGHLPDYYIVSGLLAVKAGDLGRASALFADGAAREQGRLHRAGLLAAIATMAGGNVATGVAGIQQFFADVPDNYRLIAQDLLADATPARALQALSRAEWWFGRSAYPRGALLAEAPPAAAPTVTTTQPGPEPVETPAQPAGGDLALPPIQPPEAQGQRPEAGGGATVDEVSRRRGAVAAYQAALRLLADGRPAEAEVALRSAVRLHPMLAEAWFALGQVQYQRGDDGGACNAFARATRLRPQWAEAHYALALSEDRLGLAEAAARSFTTALELGLPEPLAAYARSRLGIR